MEIAAEFCRILFFCLAGEALHVLLPLPVPAGIYGLVLLLLALNLGLLDVSRIRRAAGFLTGILPLLFIPGAVGILRYREILVPLLPVVILITVPVTCAVFAGAGLVCERLLGRKRHDP